MKVIIEKEQLVLDDYFKVGEAILQHERFDGSMSPAMRRLNFERGDSVAIFLWNTDKQKVVLTKQFRYPAYTKGEGWIVEVIAGSLKPHEDPVDAMRREILEETGYQAGELKHLHTFFVSPGGTSERIHLFYAAVQDADKVEEGGGLAAENEDIQLVEWSASELQHALDAGKIHDAKTLVAALWFLQQDSTSW
ncbi:MAG: NUDIX domain-containing protein [Flammeovirgaceae bacterium]